ncbi:MAG: carbonic anhydrase [Blastocatellia bacterium]|nr:MAG: carbonic anhydrase [Blastocatellia bacterium]
MSDIQSNISADEALQRLREGNERFLHGEIRLAGQVREQLKGLEHSQQPFATILGCSDSRVPPEVIFDCGIGELFVIRVAGNVFSNEIAASLQYAGAHLHTHLFVVLGHQNCGAVKAALTNRDQGEVHRSRIQLLVNSILPGLPPFDPGLSPEERTTQAIESNIRWTVQQILDTPEAQLRLKEGKVRIVGALVEIKTGHVKFFD